MMKWISIYTTLIILFNINFRSVCVGGDKDKQNPKDGTTQEYCNEEKEDQDRKEDAKNLPNREKETKNSNVKHFTEAKEQIAEENSYARKYNHANDYYWLVDRYDGIYERDFLYNWYFSDERDVDGSFECCNCCEII